MGRSFLFDTYGFATAVMIFAISQIVFRGSQISFAFSLEIAIFLCFAYLQTNIDYSFCFL